MADIDLIGCWHEMERGKAIENVCNQWQKFKSTAISSTGYDHGFCDVKESEIDAIHDAEKSHA